MQKGKQEWKHVEECDLDLHAQKKGSQWYIDSGCSKHMARDQNKFISLKKHKGGSVTFRDNVSTKIVRKGNISLGNEKAKVENALLVEDLRNNLVSVNQICDQGHIFTSSS